MSRMHKKIPDFPITNLTPNNSPGYEFVADVLYNSEVPYFIVKDTIDLVQNHGYKLGEAAFENLEYAGYVGLYAPTKNHARKSDVKDRY